MFCTNGEIPAKTANPCRRGFSNLKRALDGGEYGLALRRDRWDHLCVDQAIRSYSCCCEDRVRTLQIHRYVGPVRPEPLACGLANRRNSRPIPPISAVLPGKLRLPANDRSENRRSTVLDSPSSRTTHAGRPGLSFPRPKLTERFAILLKILHGEVVDFVLL